MLWKTSTQSYDKYVFFKHLQEPSPLWTGNTFPCCIYRDVFWCPWRLPGQWPCACYEALPCTNLGLSLASHKSRTGERVRKITLLQECSSACWSGGLPSISASQHEPPLHSSISSGGGTFPQFISKHRNSSQFLFWTDQRKQQKYFWNLLTGLKGHLFSLVYLADPFNYFLSPRSLPRWAREAIQTMFTVAEELLPSYSTACVFSWSHSHEGNSIVQGDLLWGFFFYLVEIVVNMKYTTMSLSSQISCTGALPVYNGQKSCLWMAVTFPFLAHVSSLSPARCTGWSTFV